MKERSKLDDILAGARERRERGDPVDPEVLIREHPEFADELRERLEAQKKPPSTASALLVQLAAGDRPSYRREGEIARGGMGAILEVRDEALHRTLAMKVILDERGGGEVDSSSTFVHRFLEEAQITAQLDHPGVVPVHELGVDEEGRVFFTMKLVKGRTLGEIFALAREEEEDWNLSRALQLLVRVCETLAFAHSKGVVHRDLKPANVMVGDFGEVYVMDWGLAKVLGEAAEPFVERDDAHVPVLSDRVEDANTPDSPHMTRAGEVLGTPLYMPVEQARGQSVDARSDVYALGAMLYELLVGHPPYAKPNEPQTLRDVLLALIAGPPEPASVMSAGHPPEIFAITEKAMARDPAERYPTASALGRDLRHFLENRVVDAHRTGAFPELRMWIRRNRALATALATAALLLLVGLLATGTLYIESEESLRNAQATGLVVASGDAQSADSTLALLLARAAVRTAETPQTVSRLRAAVQASRERAIIRRPGLHLRRLIAQSPTRDEFAVVSHERTVHIWDFDGREQAVLPVDGSVDALLFFPSGERLATLQMRFGVRIWDRKGTELARFRLPGEHPGAPILSISPSGERLLTTTYDPRSSVSRVIFLNSEGKAIATAVHEGRVASALFSPRGDLAVTTSSDKTAKIWDVDGRERAILRGHEAWVTAVSFSQNGDRILTTDREGTSRIWNVRGEELSSFRHQDRLTTASACNPSLDRFAVGSVDGTVRISSSEGEEIVVLRGHLGRVTSARFSTCGNRVLTAAADSTARLWSLDGRELAVLRGHRGEVSIAEFLPGDRRIVTLGKDSTVRIWDVEAFGLAVLREPTDTIHHADFSTSGDLIVTRSSEGGIRIWDREGKQLSAIDGIFGLFLPGRGPSEDLRILAVADLRTPRIVDSTGRVIATLRGHEQDLSTVGFSPSGDRLVTASKDGIAHVWDREGRKIAIMRGHEGEITSVAFSPSGDRIATTALWEPVRIWSRDGEPLHVIESNMRLGFPSLSSCVAFSPTGDRIAVAWGDGTARIWDRAGRELQILLRHEGEVNSVAFSPSGENMVTASDDGTARLWDRRGREISVLRGDGTPVRTAVFAPSGDRILTVSGSGTGRIWALSGEEFEVLQVPGQPILKAAYSPSGDCILSVSGDGRARLWLTRPEELLELADERLTRALTPDEIKRYGHLLGRRCDKGL